MARRFGNDFIEQVRNSNDIVQVISEYVPLKRKGNSYWGCCPFHNEKTPSFCVSPDKGFYYCFGCHASGTVITFLMERENLTFPEAMERLAERAHIPMPAEERSEAEERKEQHRRLLFEVNELAVRFFHNCLTKTHYGKEGLAYFRKRGLSDQTIADFKLGYAPDSWNKLTEAFQKRGIPTAVLLELGLAKESKGRVYDAFRNRVMFPIWDGKGRPVGFGGRVLDGGEPKYLNSPETPVFNKRKLLFAMNKAEKEIKARKQVILVEGYMDVISAHNKGVTNVVASLGTAFTAEQARLMDRIADTAVLAYDMDAAGRNATMRAFEIVKGTGLDIRVASLPEGKDPDEYLKTHGSEAFRAIMDTAPNITDYVLNDAMKRHDSTRLEGKAAIVGELLPVLGQLDNAVIADGYIRKIAQLLQLDEQAIRIEFNKHLKEQNGRAYPEMQTIAAAKLPEKKNSGGLLDSAEESLLYVLLSQSAWFKEIRGYIVSEDFTHPVRRKIFDVLAALYEQKGAYTAAEVSGSLDGEGQKEIARIMVMENVADDVEAVQDYIRKFRLEDLKKQYIYHSNRANELNKAGDPRFLEELEACKRVNEEMKNWS